MSKALMVTLIFTLVFLSSSQETATTASVSSALVCPKYTCSMVRNSTCVTQTADGWDVAKCPIGQECTFSFSSMNTSTCVVEVDIENSETCYAGYVQPNLNCTAADYCAAGYFCDAVTSTCKARTLLGANCSQNYECEVNAVCNLGICVSHFSVLDGSPSSSAVACASGIVFNGTCQAAELTNGAIPKVCTSDNDCLAADNKTQGTCVCGASKEGTAYCLAHRSDSLSLKQLASTYNGNYDEVAYYTYKLSYFYLLQSEIAVTLYEDCLDEGIEVEYYEDLEEKFEYCSPKCLTPAGCSAELGFY